MSRVFAHGSGDQGSIPGWVIPKTPKVVLDGTLLNTQHYKVRIKCKVEQSRGWSSTLLYTEVYKLLKREPSGQSWLRSPTLLTFIILLQGWFGLVWFLWLWHINLCGLFNAKAILVKEQLWYYLTYSWEDKGIYTFPKSINLKVNVMVWLEFKLAYFKAVVQSFNHYAKLSNIPRDKTNKFSVFNLLLFNFKAN